MAVVATAIMGMQLFVPMFYCTVFWVFTNKLRWVRLVLKQSRVHSHHKQQHRSIVLHHKQAFC